MFTTFHNAIHQRLGIPVLALLSLLFSNQLPAQTKVDLRTQSRGIDFTGATATKPFKTGSVLPATCTVGETFFKLGSPAGQNIYGCATTDVWTLMSGGGGAGTTVNDCTVTGSGTSASVSAPCRFSIGGVVHSITTDAVVTLSGAATSGTIYFYWDSTGNLVADENTAATLSCNPNCRTATTGGFPPGSFPLATIGFSDNFIAGGAVSDLRAYFSNRTVYCGVGLSCAENRTTGELTVAADTTNSLLTKVALQSGQVQRCVSSAGSNAHSCVMTPALLGYSTGMVVEFTPTSVAISGAATLAIDGFAAKPIKKADGLTDPDTNEISIGQQVSLRYDGTVFRLPFSARLTHVVAGGTAPTITSGFGTTPSIAGRDAAGRVTVGSGGASSGVITFGSSYSTAPACIANNEQTANLVRASATTTTLTINGTMVAADQITWICIGY